MRDSQFGKQESTKAWAIYQPGLKDRAARTWALLEGAEAPTEALGDNAKALFERVKREGGLSREVPAHWWLWPTGFDLQVHLRFPGQEDRETLEGGLLSAFVGGYDTIVTMPNTEPFLDQPALLQAAEKQVRERTRKLGLPIETLFTAAATEGMRGEKAAAIQALVAGGAVAITDDGWGVREESAMKRALELCAAAGVPFLQHAEMPGHKGHASESEFQRQHGVRPYPRTVESAMVERDLRLLQKVPGARYHVLHISTRETLSAVEQGKAAGLNVTCEVSPHHLFFDNSKIPAGSDPRSTAFKINPPLFSPEDREALVAALEAGLIDCVSTDHAPHPEAAKRGTWNEAPFGTRGLETALGTLTTLVARGVLSEKRAQDAFALGGRRVLGGKVRAPRGVLAIDPSHQFTVCAGDLPGISKNSCFVGTELTGRLIFRADPGAITTFVEGNV